MHKSIIAAVVVVVLAGLGVAAYVTLRPAPVGAPNATSTAPTADTVEPTSTPTTTLEQLPATPPVAPTGFKTYRNEEWGFSFQYPEDWEVKIPAFGSKVSKFNMSLWPIQGKRLPDPILLNITNREWMDRVVQQTKAEGVNIDEMLVSGRKTLSYESTDRSLPTIVYVIYLGNTHISLIVKKDQEYLAVFDALLDSFVITATSTTTN